MLFGWEKWFRPFGPLGTPKGIDDLICDCWWVVSPCWAKVASWNLLRYPSLFLRVVLQRSGAASLCCSCAAAGAFFDQYRQNYCCALWSWGLVASMRRSAGIGCSGASWKPIWCANILEQLADCSGADITKLSHIPSHTSHCMVSCSNPI